MNILVTSVHEEPLSTVWTAQGHDVITGDVITFAGDRRPMSALCAAVEDLGEAVEVHIEPWQVLSRRRSQYRPDGSAHAL